jgi:Cof subfamily protein (haloacid dehalogenase superfamily)
MRLFAFDIDDTILPRSKSEIPFLERKALNALLAQGDVVTLASGRPFCSLHAFLSSFVEGKKYIIIANGGALLSYSGEIIDAHYIGLKDIYHLKDEYENDNVSIYGTCLNDEIVTFKKDKWINHEIEANHIPLSKIFVLTGKNDPDVHPLKCMIAADPEYSSKIVFSNYDKEYFSIVRSTPFFLEVVPKNCSKGSQIEVLRKHLGIEKKDVYCFGDSGNDVSMLSMFNGVALGNSTPDALKVAKIITKNCEEDGVYYALHDILHFID